MIDFDDKIGTFKWKHTYTYITNNVNKVFYVYNIHESLIRELDINCVYKTHSPR